MCDLHSSDLTTKNVLSKTGVLNICKSNRSPFFLEIFTQLKFYQYIFITCQTTVLGYKFFYNPQILETVI